MSYFTKQLILLYYVCFGMQCTLTKDTQSAGNDLKLVINDDTSPLKRQNKNDSSDRINSMISINATSDVPRLDNKLDILQLKNNNNKIELVANLLKSQIDQIRHYNECIEIVFLVDASSSVGKENFNSEIIFVRKIVSNFIIGQSKTRVSVITFAGKAATPPIVDQITNSWTIPNKCTLLNDALEKVIWTGGGTYTRGALLGALSILKKSRSYAKKVVFLITDGFSNGGDPRPIAQKLKNLGTIIFSLGIKTGNVRELQDISNEPEHLHSFFLDSFVEFEAVAQRAFHQDFKTDAYVKTELAESCNILCFPTSPTSNLSSNLPCCHVLADCYCETWSGHYACRCPQGYFGTGFNNSCHPCPNGTYGNSVSSSDAVVSCTACPSPNHVTLRIPATSVDDCVCTSGFISNGTDCHAITCPKLKVPENGYLVKANACSNVFNAACGLRCQIGFKLTGDSIRLCLKNGTWSGVQTECLMKTCPAPTPPIHGLVHCEIDDEYIDVANMFSLNGSSALPIDAQCQFKCKSGFQLLGSKIRNCLPVSRWDGLQVSCKEIRCDPLPQLPNGVISPGECTNSKKLTFGTKCHIKCGPGFTLEGPTTRKCAGSRGVWNQRHVTNRCIDNSQPKITCPDNATWLTEPGKPYSLPKWTIPSITDNFDKDVRIWSKPHIIFPWKSKIGSHAITYITEDFAGNRVRCRFTIKTIDNEAPTVENCIDPLIFLSTESMGASNVVWDEPIFHDNSGKKLKIIRSHHLGSFFPFGTTQVFYNASDESKNAAICVMNITVQNACKMVPDVVNGQVHCNKIAESIECVFTCYQGYAFSVSRKDSSEEKMILSCGPGASGWNVSSMPDCTLAEIPNSMSVSGNIILQSNDSICDDQDKLQYAKNLFQTDLLESLNEICSNNGVDCQLIQADGICNRNTERKRRSFGDSSEPRSKKKAKSDRIEIKYEFIGRIISKYRNNTQKGIERLREEIEIRTKSGQLNLLNEKTLRDIGRLALNIHSIFARFHNLCEPGKIMKRNKCIRCPPGTFADHKNQDCISCIIGEYQNTSGSEKCKKCPKGFLTNRLRSTKLEDCVPICQPGSYSKKWYHGDQKLSLAPCTLCEIGFYQPYVGERLCLPCPGNMTTSERGSTRLADCHHLNYCVSDTCYNSGQCIVESAGFSCECLPGFIGSRCEFIINPCDSSPCLNRGACYRNSSTPQQFSCSCSPNYSGETCEKYLDECFPNPCNNGTCISNENDFYCQCPDHFEGEFCDQYVDLCFNVCEEGSTCVIVDGNWKCLCKPGFLGRRCHLLPCDWLPCHPNALCVNLETPNVTRSSYRCDCPEGFTGKDCTIIIDHCQSSPCLNGGTCFNHPSNFTCECSDSFDGPTCQLESRSDFVINFLRPSTMDYVILRGPKQKLTEFTICFWIQSSHSFNYGTIFSYATASNDNTITLTDYNGLVFYINGRGILTDINLNDGLWHFLCTSWRSLNGSWTIYVDSDLRKSGTEFGIDDTISANGTIIIGQDQDYLGGGFSLSESFVGRLTLLDMWDRSFNLSSLRNLQNSCQEYLGNVISWSAIKKGIRGEVKIESSHFCRDCQPLEAPSNGFVNISSDLLATYSCEIGYILKINNKQVNSSSAIRRCLKTGAWENRHFICVKIVCGFPGYFPRGKVRGNEFAYGDLVSYKCDEGFELRGNPNRTCKADGSWSGKSPICIGITCKNLLAPENGDIEYIVDEYERDDVTFLQAGQQLEFKCNEGYRLTGMNILTCLASGQWDYSPPSCVSLNCFQEPRNSKGNDSRCVSHVTCGLPPKIQNGKIENILSNFGNETIFVVGYQENSEFYRDISFSVRQQIYYTCSPGFKLFGKKSLTCLSSGKWSRFLGKCLKVSCEKPKVQENITLIGQSYLYESNLEFLCPDNKTRGVITCNADGKWSYLPDCKD